MVVEKGVIFKNCDLLLMYIPVLVVDKSACMHLFSESLAIGSHFLIFPEGRDSIFHPHQTSKCKFYSVPVRRIRIRGPLASSAAKFYASTHIRIGKTGSDCFKFFFLSFLGGNVREELGRIQRYSGSSLPRTYVS
jgi:hypothetical protein